MLMKNIKPGSVFVVNNNDEYKDMTFFRVKDSHLCNCLTLSEYQPKWIHLNLECNVLYEASLKVVDHKYKDDDEDDCYVEDYVFFIKDVDVDENDYDYPVDPQYDFLVYFSDRNTFDNNKHLGDDPIDIIPDCLTQIMENCYRVNGRLRLSRSYVRILLRSLGFKERVPVNG